MSIWTRKLLLAPEYQQARDGKITIANLAAVVARRLKSLKVPEDFDDDRDDIVYEFVALADDPHACASDFDPIMARLYDWADQSLDGKFGGKKLCWVEI